MNWILTAIGLFLIFLITEEAITYYLNKLQQNFTQSRNKTETKKESL